MDNQGVNQQSNLPENPPPPISPASVPNLEEPKGNKKYILIGVGLVILCLLFLGILFLNFQNESNDSANDQSPTPSAGQLTPVPTNRPEFRATLSKGVETDVPRTDIKATYIGRNIPGETCFDCEEAYVLEIQQGAIETILEFKCGGVTGGCQPSEELFGYIFSIGDVSTDSEFEIVLTPAQ